MCFAWLAADFCSCTEYKEDKQNTMYSRNSTGFINGDKNTAEKYLHMHTK